VLKNVHNNAEVLRLNVFATRECKFRKGEKVNLFWDDETFSMGLFRGGTQRVVHFWGNHDSFWAGIYVTTLVRLYEVPYHRHPLPISQDSDGNVWIDFSGEEADVKYLPERVRPKDATISYTEKRIAKLSAMLSDHSKMSHKTWPTYLRLYQEVSRAEGFNSFSKWVDMVLVHYVQDHHPHLWETYMNLKNSES
jgi:hypothetical protein